jgi:hypothetical protein
MSFPKFMKLKILLVCFFISYIHMGFSQENPASKNSIGLKKNVLYATLGVDYGEFYGTLLGNYERMIVEIPKTFVQSIWVRVGAGPWVWWAADGMNYVSTISLITGRRNVHFETGFGVVFTYHSMEGDFHPLVKDRITAGNLGFRFQKPGGQFVFRTGIGWPEFMYVSLGVCF